MEWEQPWNDPFESYLVPFYDLIGDRRTGVTFTETVKGIIASGSTVCRRIAAGSPVLSKAKDGAQRVLRMATGESTKRSALDADHLTGKLRERGVKHLRGSETDELWLLADGSELRKPHAHALPHLMKVRALDGSLVPGYRTLQVVGVTPQRRGLLYHRLFTSQEPGFVSEPKEVQRALQTVSRAVAERFVRRVWILDSGFDDIAVWRTIWEQEEAFVCRVKDPKRHVEYQNRDGAWQKGSIREAGERLVPLAESEMTLEVRKKGQGKSKRQAVTARIASTPLRLTYDPDVRREPGEPETPPSPRRKPPKRRETRPLWLVEIRLPETEIEPILLVCSESVEDAESAVRILSMYRQRWAIEDAYGFTKECLGWEEVQLLDLEGIRVLVALSWVAAGFLYELGVTFDWEEVRLLAKLGGYVPHKGRQPGRRVVTWGLQRLLEMLATQALLSRYQSDHGSLPSQIQALIETFKSDSQL